MNGLIPALDNHAKDSPLDGDLQRLDRDASQLRNGGEFALARGSEDRPSSLHLKSAHLIPRLQLFSW
jgi:hypothetical protein